MTDDDIIQRILSFEGGFTNNPLDKGGPTNFGITASELGQINGLGRAATVAEIQALTKDQASKIYEDKYIVGPGFERIPSVELRLIVVDSGVLHGIGRAAKWLQQTLGVPADGQIGDVTIAALRGTAGAGAAKGVLALRFKFIGQILKTDPRQVVFAQGWLNRVADLIQYC
jgi:lysozyme family protein